MRIPLAVSSTTTWDGCSNPYLRAVSAGIIRVADILFKRKVLETVFLISDIAEISLIRYISGAGIFTVKKLEF